MIRNALCTITAFISVVLFPWPLTALVAVIVSFFEPLVPFAVGLFADTLYYLPATGGLPTFTLYGLAMSIVAVFVRSQLHSSIIG